MVPYCERNRSFTTGLVCTVGYLLGLCMCTQNGDHVLAIMDHFVRSVREPFESR